MFYLLLENTQEPEKMILKNQAFEVVGHCAAL